MPWANPPVRLLNIFSLETVPPLISLLIWGQRCSFIHNWHFCPRQVCKSPEETPGRALSFQIDNEMNVVLNNLV